MFVQDFPATGARFQVSTRGGSEPRWRQDGRELFYLAADGQLMAVAVVATPEFKLGIPTPVFQTGLSKPAPDSTTTLRCQPRRPTLPDEHLHRRPDRTPITVITNWQRALEGR